MKLTLRPAANIRLTELLQQFPFSRREISILKEEGRIAVNGQIIKNDLTLNSGDQVEIDISKPESSEVAPSDKPLRILYEDDLVLVADKPAGILVHDDGNSQITLDNLVAGHYQRTNQNHPILHVHRLDYGTSGALLYCKERCLMAYFDNALAAKAIKRRYLALVKGRINEPLTIDQPIGRDRHVSGKYRICPTGKNAVTHVKPLRYLQNDTLCECELETGRTHQIRVHLAAIGHPIKGDDLYGGESHERMMLHSCYLHFYQPVKGVSITVTSPWQFNINPEESGL